MLDVYTIRNALSHPNRPFHPSYWRRVAALASDPCIQELGLDSVTGSLHSAEIGIIEPPPAGWIDRHRWEIPSNLPKQTEHSITGLIGRKSEVKKLQKALVNARFPLVAITGPGGVGKTALVLDVLRHASNAAETSEWADSIHYVTAKTERLTKDGPIPLPPSTASIEDLQRQLAPVVEGKEDGRLLLCIDNLETLLLNDPDAFLDFYAELPRGWKVLVTSRIPVATAYTIPLGELDESGGQALARAYANCRAHKTSAEETATIVALSNRNPLAVRLCIDSLCAGVPLMEATQSSRERIIEFSYKNLVCALPDSSRRALECLFASPDPLSREEVAALLDIDREVVIDAFRSLSGTALVIRSVSENSESFALNDLVREFLQIEPISVEYRALAFRALRRRHGQTATNLQAVGTSPEKLDYLPSGSSEPLRITVAKVCSVLEAHDRRSISATCQDVVRELELSQGPQCAVLGRLAGILYEKLDDRVKAKEHLKRAAMSAPPDLCALLNAIRLHRTDQELEVADLLADRLFSTDALDPTIVGGGCACIAFREYWVTKIWLGRTPDALDATESWREQGVLRSEAGAVRAQILRSQIDGCITDASIGRKNSDIAEVAMSEALIIWRELIVADGFHGLYAALVWKLVSSAEVAYRMGIIRSPDVVLQMCDFLDLHLRQLCSTHDDLSIDSGAISALVEAFRNAVVEREKNPLLEDSWSDLRCTSAWKRVTRVFSAKVKRVPRQRDFLFAMASDGQEYFCHKSRFERAGEIWSEVQEGDGLLIAPEWNLLNDSSRLPRAYRVVWEGRANAE